MNFLKYIENVNMKWDKQNLSMETDTSVNKLLARLLKKQNVNLAALNV